MTQQQHPISPPPELVKRWLNEFYGPQSMPGMAPGEMVLHVAAVAARWGADQELEACCEWLALHYPHVYTTRLKRCRRPEPPSLKEQALEQLKSLEVAFLASHGGNAKTESIRRALESLPN